VVPHLLRWIIAEQSVTYYVQGSGEGCAFPALRRAGGASPATDPAPAPASTTEGAGRQVRVTTGR
jgi:hypothetical protein